MEEKKAPPNEFYSLPIKHQLIPVAINTNATASLIKTIFENRKTTNTYTTSRSITTVQKTCVEDTISKQPDTAEKVRKYTRKSHTLGLIALFATILFIFWPLTVPTAIICGILAVKRGRQAINEMGTDETFKIMYRNKARAGIKMGLSFFLFFTALLFIGLLVGLAFLGMAGVLYSILVFNVPYLALPWILLMMIAAFFVIKLGVKAEKAIIAKYCPA